MYLFGSGDQSGLFPERLVFGWQKRNGIWSPRTINPRVATSSFLLLLGIGTLGLGLSDAYSTLVLEYRILGFVACILALILIVGSIDLFLTRNPEPAFIAGLAGVIVGAYLLFAQWGYAGLVRLIPWTMILLTSGALSMLSWRLMPRERDVADTASSTSHPGPRPKEMRRVRRVVGALGLSAGLIWGVFQFWYEKGYLPGAEGATLTLSTEIEEIESSSQLRLFVANITMKNTTKTRVQVLSSLYRIMGVRLGARNRNDAAFLSEAVRIPHDSQLAAIDSSSVSRFSLEAQKHVLQFGTLVEEGWYFEPAEEHLSRIVISVPRKSNFDSIRLSLTVAVAKGTRLTFDETSPAFGPKLVTRADKQVKGEPQYVVTERPIRRLSRILSLTRGDQSLYIIRWLRFRDKRWAAHFELPDLTACVDHRYRLLYDESKFSTRPDMMCDPFDVRQLRFNSFYGITGAKASYELPVTPPTDNGKKN